MLFPFRSTQSTKRGRKQIFWLDNSTDWAELIGSIIVLVDSSQATLCAQNLFINIYLWFYWNGDLINRQFYWNGDLSNRQFYWNGDLSNRQFSNRHAAVMDPYIATKVTFCNLRVTFTHHSTQSQHNCETERITPI